MKNQQKLKPRVPMQVAPVARQGGVKNEKGVGPSYTDIMIGQAMYDLGRPFAVDDAE